MINFNDYITVCESRIKLEEINESRIKPEEILNNNSIEQQLNNLNDFVCNNTPATLSNDEADQLFKLEDNKLKIEILFNILYKNNLVK